MMNSDYCEWTGENWDVCMQESDWAQNYDEWDNPMDEWDPSMPGGDEGWSPFGNN